MNKIPDNPIKFRPNREKGETLKVAYDKLISGVSRNLRDQQRNGKIGIKNTISKDNIKNSIEKICLKNGYLKRTDKLIIYAYPAKLEYLYHRVINSFLQNPNKDNVFFMPGLVTNNGVGVYFTESDNEVNIYKKKKMDTLKHSEISLEHRCIEAYDFVKVLPPHESKPELDEHIDVA